MCNRWGISCLSQNSNVVRKKINIIEHAKINRVVVATVTFLLTHSCWQIITQIHTFISVSTYYVLIKNNLQCTQVSVKAKRRRHHYKLKPQSTHRKKVIVLLYSLSYKYYFKCVTTWSGSLMQNFEPCV